MALHFQFDCFAQRPMLIILPFTILGESSLQRETTKNNNIGLNFKYDFCLLCIFGLNQSTHFGLKVGKWIPNIRVRTRIRPYKLIHSDGRTEKRQDIHMLMIKRTVRNIVSDKRYPQEWSRLQPHNQQLANWKNFPKILVRRSIKQLWDFRCPCQNLWPGPSEASERIQSAQTFIC